MQRRVELAKGLIHSPAVLLLDEPTTGLDPGARLDLWQYLRMLRDEEGVTVLVTTHMMEEAEHCDRLAILNEGKLVALGSPEELKSTIGGDVVLFETETEHAAQSLAARMAGRFEVAPTVLGNTVRLERENGHRFLTAVLEAFPGEVRAVSVSRPRLEDVFIQRTGHRFWTEATDGSVKEKRRDRLPWPPSPPPRLITAAIRTAQPGLWFPSYSLWQREIVRFYRQRARVIGVIASPLLFWIAFGAGFSHPSPPATPGPAATPSATSSPAPSS